MDRESREQPPQPPLRHKVRRMPGSRQWGIYLGEVLVEGGFFNETVALEVAWEHDNPLPPGQDRECPF